MKRKLIVTFKKNAIYFPERILNKNINSYRIYYGWFLIKELNKRDFMLSIHNNN